MELYIALFILITVFGMYSDREIISYQHKTIVHQKTLLIAIILILFLISAVRQGIGTDYILYKIIYEKAEEDLLQLGWGYTFVSQLFRSLHLNYQLFIAWNAFIFLSVIYYFIKKLSTYHYISLLTLLGTYSYFTSFNTFRQITSISIVLLALIFLYHHKKAMISIILFVCSVGIHKSSLMYFPLFFLNYIKLSKMTYQVIMLVSLIGFFVMPENIKTLIFEKFFALSSSFSTKYEDSVFIVGEERGFTNKLFFLFYWLMTFRLYGHKNGSGMNSKWIEQSFLFYILINSFFPYSNIINRISLFYELLAVVMIPKFISSYQTVCTKNIIKGAILLIFLVRLVYVLRLNGGGVVPYSSIFSGD